MLIGLNKMLNVIHMYRPKYQLNCFLNQIKFQMLECNIFYKDGTKHEIKMTVNW